MYKIIYIKNNTNKYKNINFHKINVKNGSNAIFSKNNYYTGIMYKTFLCGIQIFNKFYSMHI